MSEQLARLKQSQRKDDDEPELNAHEQTALDKLRSEAKKHGATLATNGEGGLPPSTVLGAMRRDGFRCKLCGTKENLSVHHRAHLENPSPKMQRFGKNVDQRNDLKAIITCCESCHDSVHARDRTNVEGNT